MNTSIISAIAIMAGAVIFPLALPGIIEQAQREPRRMDEDYWLESGYDPLPESSCSETDADAQPYEVKPL